MQKTYVRKLRKRYGFIIFSKLLNAITKLIFNAIIKFILAIVHLYGCFVLDKQTT